MDFLANQECSILPPTPGDSNRVERVRQRSKAEKFTWFAKNEYLWRSVVAYLWFMFLLPLISFIYRAVVLFSIRHPYLWFIDVFSKLLSFWVAFIFVIVLGVTLSPVVLLNVKICSVDVRCSVENFSVPFCNLQMITHATFSILSTSLAIWCMMSFTLLDDAVLKQNCTKFSSDDEPYLCINETTLFHYVFAFILGATYSFFYFKNEEYQIKFPVVQRERIFRVKACLFPCFHRATNICFKTLPVVYTVYFFFGTYIKDFCASITGLLQDRQRQPLNSLIGFIDFYLFWFCLISGAFILFALQLANKLFIIVYTEVFRFPVQSTFSEDSNQTLPVALKCNTSPLLKYLAFHDLSQLSQYSMTRRKQIFSLSIPGGRPLNWLCISEECLTLMNDLQQRLYFYVNHHNMTISKDEKTVLETPSRHYQEVTPSSVETFFPNSVNSRVKNISSLQSDSTRNSSTQKHLEDLKHKKKVTTMERIKNIPFMKYLIKPINESEMEEIFFDVQLQIWTAEGISRLVAASYSEDVFGVVQSTLPFILTSLLELLQMVEIYLKKLTNEELLNHQRRQPNEMRKSVNVLRDTLRSSIYRITKTFQNHISDVELSTKNREFLINFLKFLA